MPMTTRPLFALYVVWHPAYAHGRALADALRQHFRRDLYRSVAGEPGISVLERSESPPGSRIPLPIDWDDAELTAIVALIDESLVADPEWAGYVRELADAAQARGLPAGFFPVEMDGAAFDLRLEQQALHWDRWDAPDEERVASLTRELIHEFCRMLRHRVDEQQPDDGVGAPALGRYLEKVQVFISHSKHDADGATVARNIRDWIHDNGPVDSFFDVHDIPPGLLFEEVLVHQAGTSAMVAVHTDSYSSREWCRREVIEAKRHCAPMVVLDCVRDVDPRSMAYLGNVPVVRMEPGSTDRIGAVAGRLLDEVFRTWLWRCRVGPHASESPEVLFTARPPELIALAAFPAAAGGANRTIVYPEPLLGVDEERLFSEIAPTTRLQTLERWMEEL